MWLVAPWGPPGTSKNPSKIYLHFDASFYSILGSISARYWSLFCSNFAPRLLLDTHLYQKYRCSRNPLKTNEKSMFLTSRRLRIYQLFDHFWYQWTHFFGHPFWHRFGFYLGSILAPFGLLLAPQNRYKIGFGNQVAVTNFPRPSQEVPRPLQGPPRWPQEASETLPRPPKRTPRGLKDLLRWAPRSWLS